MNGVFWFVTVTVFTALSAPVPYWWSFIYGGRRAGASWETILTAIDVEMEQPARRGHWSIFLFGYAFIVYAVTGLLWWLLT